MSLENKLMEDIDDTTQLLSELIMDERVSRIECINNRIRKEFCKETFKLLSDSNLMNKYQECKSVRKNIIKLRNVLVGKNISSKIQEEIIEEFMLELIPAGTKGVIRGNEFNSIIKKYLLNLELSLDIFDIKFETKHDNFLTCEIPDWYIYDKKHNKIIIGMNQLDLWGGGHQFNRGSKYLIDHINISNSKLLCVVCNFIEIKSDKNKVFRFFDVGFRNDTICYLNGLKRIIDEYFGL